MGKKRKPESSGLDEVERTLYTSFCTAANSISQLYTHSQNQQQIAYQAGERQAMEKLLHWITKEQNGASFVSVDSVVSFLQKELDSSHQESDSHVIVPQQHQQAASSQFNVPTLENVSSSVQKPAGHQSHANPSPFDSTPHASRGSSGVGRNSNLPGPAVLQCQDPDRLAWGTNLNQQREQQVPPMFEMSFAARNNGSYGDSMDT